MTMRLFQFTSQTKPTIHAFAADAEGTRLPDRLAPWKLTRALGARQELPHRLSREEIERGVTAMGYQLWRLKTPANPS